MIALASTAYRLASTRAALSEWLTPETAPDAELQALRRNGAEAFHCADNEGLLALAEPAIQDALEAARIHARDVDALVVCHTSPLSALPAPYTLAGALRERARLSGAYAFSVTQQQCVSSVHALRVLAALFEQRRRWRCALLVNADMIAHERYRKIGVAGVHSDAASAMLLCPAGQCRIRGLYTHNARQPPTEQGHSAEADLFATDPSFVWTLVSVMRRILNGAQVEPDALTSVIPHNVNLTAWHQALSALRIPNERLFQANFPRLGHAFGSDAAINLTDSGALRAPGSHLVFSSGVGGCFGGFVLQTEAQS